MSADAVIAGVGMTPWGKWGRNFVEYGVAAIRDAVADAGIDYRDVQFVAGADTMRNGYPGYVAGATFAQAMGCGPASCPSGIRSLSPARRTSPTRNRQRSTPSRRSRCWCCPRRWWRASRFQRTSCWPAPAPTSWHASCA